VSAIVSSSAFSVPRHESVASNDSFGACAIVAQHHDNPLESRGYFGGTLKGIYEISPDSLTICFDMTGRDYPPGFDAPRGSRRIIYKFARQRP
jgi:hypothetical protein